MRRHQEDIKAARELGESGPPNGRTGALMLAVARGKVRLLAWKKAGTEKIRVDQSAAPL